MQTSTILAFLFRLVFLLLSAGIFLPVCATPLKVSGLAVLDPVHALDDIGAVSAADRQALFKPLNDVYIGGYTDAPRWLRFTVKVPTPGTWWLEIQPAILDDVRIFIPNGSGYSERRTGDGWPFNEREEGYRSFVFKLNIEDTEPRTYYLRLSSSSSLMAQLRLWQPADFRNAKYAEYSVASFIGGVLFLIFLINVFLWCFLRLHVILWFSLHVLTNLVLVAFSSGLVSQFLFSENPGLSNTLSQFTLPLLLSGSAPLLKSLVSRNWQAKWLDHLFLAIAVLPLLFALPIFLGSYTHAAFWMLVLSLPFYALMTWIVLKIWWQTGYQQLYLWPGVLFTVIGGALSTLIMLGWLNIERMPVGFFRPSSFGMILAMQTGILILVHDINKDKKNATERAIRAEMDVQNERKAVDEQSRFIAMLTHELKTPLAVIDAATQTLERTVGADRPNVLWRYDRIRRAVRRIERLVDQFLSADQVDHVRGRLNLSTFDAVRLLKGVADVSLCAPERIRLQAPDKCSLTADAGQLRIALTNLVDNAIKYSPPESPIFVRLQPCLRHDRSGVEFVVVNQGQGIPPALHDKIFSRYTRGEDVGHISGAGLGLYLVQRIVQAHQGEVSVQTDPQGTAFHVWLPGAIQEGMT